MRIGRNRLAYFAVILFMFAQVSGCASLKKKNVTNLTLQEPNPPKPLAIQPEKKEHPFDKIITPDAKKDSGLFNVYQVKDRYYYEIPDSLFGREMLMVTNISKSAENVAYGGQNLQNQVLRWEKFKDNVLLRIVSYNNIANDTLPIYMSVQNSNFEPILESFSIKSISKDSTGVLIDVTDLFSTDVKALNLSQEIRSKFKISSFDRSRSYISRVSSYPMNIEARHVMTYTASRVPGNDHGFVTFEISNSMVLLPEKPMKPRLHDKRVGYFTTSQIDYGSDAQKAEKRTYIRRWRLEPKDMDAYLRGELVEPKKPIVFYIDPATPVKWRPYFKQGVEDWQKAFEAAGFKNAIQAKYPPTKEEDPEWSAEDARYSVIRYFASEIRNAYGPNIQDPRSGEIIESDIGWYHNVMNLLRNWYFVQTAAANPKARGVKFDDETMGRLIRFVVTHEVGHTLGLMHNMGASHAYPVDSLRSRNFTDKYGTSPSIMDYARFNYIAQPEDSVTNFCPVIGEYDIYAIKWGYSLFPEESVWEEKKKLTAMVVEHANDPSYFFGRQVYDPTDPRSQTEDLGDNAIMASYYGIQNLKRIIPNLIEWTYEEGKTYEELEELYKEILSQWYTYVGHVKSNIGGVYETISTYDQDKEVYQPVPKDIQRDAIRFLHVHAFETPEWVLDSRILDRIEPTGAVKRISDLQERILNQVLSLSRISRVIESHAQNPQEAYSLVEMMSDLREGLFSEIPNGEVIDIYRRSLQRAYIARMAYLMGRDVNNSDIRSVVRGELKRLQTDIEEALARYPNLIEKYHLEDIAERIKTTLNPRS